MSYEAIWMLGNLGWKAQSKTKRSDSGKGEWIRNQYHFSNPIHDY